jgi:protoporphyrinogen oxidase
MARILILGAGPTGLGAAYRLDELGHVNYLILEASEKSGGLAKSHVENGYTWDHGGHVTFSHYDYYDNVTNLECNNIPRESYVWYQNKYIPYPIQQSVSMLDNIEEIKKSYDNRSPMIATNFLEYCNITFGSLLTENFMKPYNEKVWQTPIGQMSHKWVGERVASPNFEDMSNKDKKWGPNSTFRYPVHGGNGRLWDHITDKLPKDVIRYNTSITRIDHINKIVYANDGKYRYDILINTIPLDTLSTIFTEDIIPEARKLRKTRLRISGLGFSTPLPEELSNKSWIYYSDNEPCYRVTVLSSYSPNMTPEGKWSLLCESDADVELDSVIKYYSRFGNIETTWTTLLDHGYPVPTLNRDNILEEVQNVLHQHNIYSRGRFGGWKYEVSNQDHSFMQGVEVIDKILLDQEEVTYYRPDTVNCGSKLLNTRTKQYPKVELVIAHYSENLDWLEEHKSYARLYVKSSRTFNDIRYIALPNVGRETHTYLTHITRNYENLADVTIFNQGRIDDHSYYTYSNPLEHLKHLKEEVSFKIRERYDNWGRMIHKNPWLNNLINGRMRPAKYTLARTWLDLFGYEHPPYIEVCYAACFAVTRNQIRKRPREFYEKCLTYVSDCNDPEDSHYFERLWISIFTDDEVLKSRK